MNDDIDSRQTAALHRARDIAARLAGGLPALATLADRWHDAPGQSEADAIALAPLELRQEAERALDDVEALLDADPEDSEPIDAVAEQLTEAIAAFDEALLPHIDCLATLADGEILKAWRRELPEGAIMPWWLNGTLEVRSAALAVRTDALAERFARAFGRQEGPAIQPATPAAAARAVRRAGGFALAAAATNGSGITTLAWRHPALPVEAVLWLPASFAESGQARMVFRGSPDRREERELVGEIVLLGGVPAVVRSVGDAGQERAEASWPGRDLAAAIGDAAALRGARGEQWIPHDEPMSGGMSTR